MTRTFVWIFVVSLVTPVVAQTAQEQAELLRRRAVEAQAQADGLQRVAPRVAVETRVTPNKPYAGEAVTEFVQVLGDGNRIVRKSSARLYRDSEGRTRRDEGSDNERGTVVISDPIAGTSFILNPENRTAVKAPAAFARVQSGTFTVQGRAGAGGGSEPKVEVFTIQGGDARKAAEAAAQVAVAEASSRQTATFTGVGGVLVASATPGQKEDLGQQVIEGVTANGTRTTTVIAAGAIGNEQPITIVSEQWYSPDLELLVLTRHNDPRVGETTYRLINVSRSEPDRSLFQVPADYTMQERLMWRQQPRQ